MAEAAQPLFDAPIPGMSLTHELGARPWQSPPKLVTVDDAIEHYLERMSTDDFSNQLLDVLEMGVPVTDLANIIQLGGVMEGLHTIDTGMLVLPVLIEMVMLIADSAQIEYETGLEQGLRKDRPRDSLVQKTLLKLESKMEDNEEAAEETEEPAVEEEAPTGLMSRRV
tara:strand:+ start:2166 stop:2669 length:504 start_codon:yes stop_codon:yes gene_type:complete